MTHKEKIAFKKGFNYGKNFADLDPVRKDCKDNFILAVVNKNALYKWFKFKKPIYFRKNNNEFKLILAYGKERVITYTLRTLFLQKMNIDFRYMHRKKRFGSATVFCEVQKKYVSDGLPF